MKRRDKSQERSVSQWNIVNFTMIKHDRLDVHDWGYITQWSLTLWRRTNSKKTDLWRLLYTIFYMPKMMYLDFWYFWNSHIYPYLVKNIDFGKINLYLLGLISKIRIFSKTEDARANFLTLVNCPFFFSRHTVHVEKCIQQASKGY